MTLELKDLAHLCRLYNRHRCKCRPRTGTATRVGWGHWGCEACSHSRHKCLNASRPPRTLQRPAVSSQQVICEPAGQPSGCRAEEWRGQILDADPLPWSHVPVLGQLRGLPLRWAPPHTRSAHLQRKADGHGAWYGYGSWDWEEHLVRQHPRQVPHT